MVRKLLQIATGVTLLATCTAAHAQRHSVPRMGTVAVAPARSRVVRTPQASFASVSTQLVSPNTVFGGSFGSVSVGPLIGTFPVPGFGFDFTHFAAVNRNLGIRALIDPATQLQLALARQILRETPFFPFVTAFPFSQPEVVVVPQPQVIVVQQPVPVEEREERGRRVEAAAQPQPRREPQPVEELGELVLVRSDGRVLFAVAFSRVNERLVYVTREGIRRSFPLSELDVDATQQMNEERGTSLRLPI